MAEGQAMFSPEEVENLFSRPAEAVKAVEEHVPVQEESFIPPSSTQQQQSAPVQQPINDPRVEALQGQVGFLSNLVGQIFQKGFEQPKPQQQQVDPFQEILQPKDFFTPEDAIMLTQGNKPIETLNKMGNSIKESVAKPLLNVIQQQQALIQNWQKEQQEREYRAGQQKAAEEADREFFDKFSDLKDMQSVVRYEAAMLAEQARQNPSLLAGKSREEAANILAERVRGLRQQWVNGASGEGGSREQVASAPVGRKAHYLERGGSSRGVAEKVEKDPNKQSLREMSNFIQGKTRR